MSLYDKLPVGVLVAFYYEILKNIEKGILTKRMYEELELISNAAERKNVTIIHKKSLSYPQPHKTLPV